MGRRLVLLALFLAAGACGGGEPGFRIDQVSVKPDDIPILSVSNESIKISALVYNETHEVTEVLVRSDEALLFVDLIPGRYPKWTGEVPVTDFYGYTLGSYWLDVEARDDGNRVIVLDDAVRFRILED